MRARTMILFLVAIVLAGGTAMLVRSWLAQQRTVVAEAAPMPPPALPQKSVLVARSPIARGQKLKEDGLGLASLAGSRHRSGVYPNGNQDR